MPSVSGYTHYDVKIRFGHGHGRVSSCLDIKQTSCQPACHDIIDVFSVELPMLTWRCVNFVTIVSNMAKSQAVHKVATKSAHCADYAHGAGIKR